MRQVGRGPLSGIRVLEIARFISGPYAGQILADLGADVIKLESPDGGDPFRSFRGGLYGTPFLAFNRNKRSVTVDLKSQIGRTAVLELAEHSDVLLENFRPGVMSSLGLDYESLRPSNGKLIYCSLTGFGESGPYRHRPAYDTIAQASSGMLSQLVDPHDPRLVGPAFADGITGMAAAQAILAAIIARERTHRGQYVEVPMLSSTLSFLTAEATQFLNTGEIPGPYYRPSGSQSYVLRCADNKLIALHLSSPEKFWVGLVDAMGRPDLLQDSRFSSRTGRIDNYLVLNEELAREFARQPLPHWRQRLEERDVPYSIVHTMDEVFLDAQVRHLDLALTLEHPEEGTVVTVAPPARFSETPWEDLQAPPTLGQDTRDVLDEIGVKSEDFG